MKQILLASAALLAVNGQQHLRRSTPIDLTPAIPERPILRIPAPINNIPEVPEFPAELIDTIPEKNGLETTIPLVDTVNNEFIAVPPRLQPAIPERPSWNETHIPLNMTKLPIYNITLNGTRPILRLPIDPIRITDPVLNYAIAADELTAIPPGLEPAIPERPIDFIPLNVTYNPLPRPIIGEPIKEPITIEDNEFIATWNGTHLILNGTAHAISIPNFNGTIDPRPVIPERPRIQLFNETFIPIEEPLFYPQDTIVADEELIAIPERLQPAIPERPEFRFPNGTIGPLPIGTIDFPFNGTIHLPHLNRTFTPLDRPIIGEPIKEPITIEDNELLTRLNVTLNGTVIPIDSFPVFNGTIGRPIFNHSIRLPNGTYVSIKPVLYAEDTIAADEELIAIPERLRPAIPERPIINIPITIDPIELHPMPVSGTPIAADDEYTAIPERLRPAIPERPIIEPIPAIKDPSMKPTPIPITIPKFKAMPISTAIAADDEYTAIPERLRPAIPERPIIKIPITIDPRERPIPIPTIIDPTIKPVPIPTVRPMPIDTVIAADYSEDTVIGF